MIDTLIHFGLFMFCIICSDHGLNMTATATTQVYIFRIDTKEVHSTITTLGTQPELVNECVHVGHIACMHLKATRDTIVVGDLMRSVALLQYSKTEKTLKEIARDFNLNYMRSVEMFDTEGYYFGADDCGNLFSLRYQAEAGSEEEKAQLEACAEFNLGDVLNVAIKGSLVGQPIDSDVHMDTTLADATSAAGQHSDAKGFPAFKSIFDNDYTTVTGYPVGSHNLLFGAVSGRIGNLITLSEDCYRFFQAVEKVMRQTRPSVGHFSHQDWRNFNNQIRTSAVRNMIDGDLVESFMDLSDRVVIGSVTKEINDELNAFLTSVARQDATKPDADEVTSALMQPEPVEKAKSKMQPGNSSTTEAVLSNLMTSDKVLFSAEDIFRRVEEMSRLH